MHASTYIEYLPEIILETANGTYKIPQYTAQFEGNITMEGEEKQHFDMRFNKLSFKRLWLKGVLIIGVSFIRLATMNGS